MWLRGDTEGERVRPEDGLGATPRVDQRLAGRHPQADQTALGDPARVEAEHAEVVVVGDRAHRDAMPFSRRDDGRQGAVRDHRTQPLLSVDGQVARAEPLVLARVRRARGAVAQSAEQSGQPEQAVRRHSLRLGDDQELGLLTSGGGRHSRGHQESFGQGLCCCEVCAHSRPSQG